SRGPNPVHGGVGPRVHAGRHPTGGLHHPPRLRRRRPAGADPGRPRATAGVAVPTYLMRVWVPDRPGALGGVASRIGAVRGDLVGIDILERGAGRAIDELVVELPDAGLLDLLVNEVSQVDGVDVEYVRPLERHVP